MHACDTTTECPNKHTTECNQEIYKTNFDTAYSFSNRRH